MTTEELSIEGMMKVMASMPTPPARRVYVSNPATLSGIPRAEGAGFGSALAGVPIITSFDVPTGTVFEMPDREPLKVEMGSFSFDEPNRSEDYWTRLMISGRRYSQFRRNRRRTKKIKRLQRLNTSGVIRPNGKRILERESRQLRKRLDGLMHKAGYRWRKGRLVSPPFRFMDYRPMALYC